MWRPQLSLPHAGESAFVAQAEHSFASQTRWETVWRFWGRRVARTIVLLLTDLAALLLAASLGYGLWAHSVLHQPLEYYLEFVPLFFLFPLGYAGAGLYPGFGMGAVETLRRLSCCTSFAFLALAAASFVMKLPPHHSRMTYAVAWGASLVLVPSARFITLSIVSRWRWWREPALLVGSKARVQWMIHTLRNAFLSWLSANCRDSARQAPAGIDSGRSACSRRLGMGAENRRARGGGGAL